MSIAPNHRSRIPRRRWLIASLLGFGVLINYFDRVNLSVAKEALHHDFGFSNIAWGYLLSTYNWTYAALQVPTGVLLDRFGIQTIGRIGAFVWSVAAFGTALSRGIRTLFLSRLLFGVGEAPTFPAYAKATGYWFPLEERSLATAIFDSAAKFSGKSRSRERTPTAIEMMRSCSVASRYSHCLCQQ